VELQSWASTHWAAAGLGLAAADKPDQRGELSSSLTEGHTIERSPPGRPEHQQDKAGPHRERLWPSRRASEPQQGHHQHWDRIDARARAREEAQDGLHRRSWRVKDKMLTLKDSREEQSRADKTGCIQGPTSAGTHRSCSPDFSLGICVCFFNFVM